MAVPDIGDLVAVLDVGAYGFSQSMPFFGSYPIPPEVVIDGDAVSLARPRIDPAAWLASFAGEDPMDAVPERGLAEPRVPRARAAQGG
jgi:hypothetical protein